MKAHRSPPHFRCFFPGRRVGSPSLRPTQPSNVLLREIQRGMLLLILVLGLPLGVQAELLQAYAAKCDLETRIAVPEFHCDGSPVTPGEPPAFSVEIPTTHAFASLLDDIMPISAPKPSDYARIVRCDRPNRLNGKCDPGSRFHVLNQTDDAFVVGLCRKKGEPGNTWGDIAVIQHNATSGATCFYQQGPRSGLSNVVKKPSDPANNWNLPAVTAGQQCVACHNNGPLVRSPYLSKIIGDQYLPGGFNQRTPPSPYYFVGEDFASWAAYSVETFSRGADDPTNTPRLNPCLTCHRMGMSTIGGLRPVFVDDGGMINDDLGAALDFGIRATQQSLERSKNPHGQNSPLWMPSPLYPIQFVPANFNSATEIRLYKRIRG